MAQNAFWGNDRLLFRDLASLTAPTEFGWRHDEVLNLNLSFASSHDVVGQTDGTTQIYGTNSRFSFSHLTAQDEWRNDFFLREATTHAASLPRFVKSDDEFKLTTTYLYFLPANPKIGPYARAEASTPLFKGEDVHPDMRFYRATNADGTIETYHDTSTRLTDPLRPLTTREALGFFNRPISTDRFHLELRLGAAGQQIKARGSYVVKGPSSDGYLDIAELKDVSQTGLEAAVALRGKINDRSSYEAGLDSLTPFINNKPAGDDRSPWGLTNVEGYVKLNSKVTEWASFSYDYKLKIEPQLVNRAQQIHMVVIGLNYPVAKAN